MLRRCVDWNFIQAKQALARGTLRKTLSLSWNVCKLVLVMDLEPLISHQFHYCVQRTSTYFNVTMAKMEGFKLHLGPPAVSPKPTWATRQNTCHSKCSNPLKTDFDSSTLRPHGVHGGTVLSRRALRLPNSCNKTSKTPRHSACRWRACNISPSSVSSVNVPQRIPPIQNMFETHHITTAHSDLDAFKTFWWCNVIRYGRCVLILRFHKLKDVHHSSEFDGDENEAPKSSSIHVSCSHAESSQSIFIYESNLDWTNQDEFIIYIYRVPLERPAQSGWPGQGQIHWMSWISLYSVWSEDEWSIRSM